jgi:hypothetical protein
MSPTIGKKFQFIEKDFNMPVTNLKLSKKSEKEIINPDIKRIAVFCTKIRPGRSASRGLVARIRRRTINNTSMYDSSRN